MVRFNCRGKARALEGYPAISRSPRPTDPESGVNRPYPFSFSQSRTKKVVHIHFEFLDVWRCRHQLSNAYVPIIDVGMVMASVSSASIFSIDKPILVYETKRGVEVLQFGKAISSCDW